eukprot:scaffold43068_cov57-Phaeocystis_antarctica.AAC.2
MPHSERWRGRIAVRARFAHQHTALATGLIVLRPLSSTSTASAGVPCKRSERCCPRRHRAPLANDARRLALRCGGYPLVLRHTRARRPRPLQAGLSPEAAERELARPKGRSPVSAADLARGVAAAPTNKAAKSTNTSLATEKGGLPGEKGGAREAKKSG